MLAEGKIREFLTNNISMASAILASLSENIDEITAIAESLMLTIKNGGTIYTCGNGGSACDAMHFTEELVARYSKEREGIRSAHFCDPGILTCWSNDYDYHSAFERQAKTFLKKEDTLFAFSTSGNSSNVNKALAVANIVGCNSVALLGKTGGESVRIAKHALVVRSNITAHIQQAHITVVHMLCELLEM